MTDAGHLDGESKQYYAQLGLLFRKGNNQRFGCEITHLIGNSGYNFLIKKS